MTKINLMTRKDSRTHKECFIVQRNKLFKRKIGENELEMK